MRRLPAVLLTMLAVTGCASVVPGVAKVADQAWIPADMKAAPNGLVAYRWPTGAEVMCLGGGGCYSIWLQVPQKCKGMDIRLKITRDDGTTATVTRFDEGVFPPGMSVRVEIPALGSEGDDADVQSITCGPA